jgi:hypothetical protein
VWSRREPGPAFDVPLAEIMDVLVQTGERLTRDPDGLLAQALEASARTSPLPRDVLERSYASLGRVFNRRSMQFQVDAELGGADVLDGWREVKDAPSGRSHRTRAFPPRLIHVIAGNAPGVAAVSVVRGALTKGVHLLKLPSNDLFSATAILRAMAAVAPDHPVSRSFSAAVLARRRRQGREPAVPPAVLRQARRLGRREHDQERQAVHRARAFELVAFDPEDIDLADRPRGLRIRRDAGRRGRACRRRRDDHEPAGLRIEPGAVRRRQRRRGRPLLRAAAGAPGGRARDHFGLRQRAARELRDEIDGLRDMQPHYRVWGGYEGRGLVIRSEEPVDFHPTAGSSTSCPVASLAEAVRHANVATQTVGVYPPSRKAELRDALARPARSVSSSSARRSRSRSGMSHDGFLPLQRFVRWVNDEG